ncbi:MAG: hypothetical protein ACK5H2_04290 [Beutenbergiaceae bacterium]
MSSRRQAVGQLLGSVLLGPIRHGRPMPRTWPLVLQLLGVISLTVVIVGAVLIVGSGPLRRASPMLEASPGFYVPEVAYPYLTTAGFVALTLLQIAILHIHWAARIVGLVAALGAFIAPTASLPWPSLIIAGLAWLGLIVIQVCARHGFRNWQVAAVASCVFVGMHVPRLLGSPAADYGFDLRGLHLSLLVQVLAAVAIPSLVVAGAALTQMAVAAGEATGRAVAALPRIIALTGLAAALIWRGVSLIGSLRSAPESLTVPHLLDALTVLLATLALAFPFLLRAARAGAHPASTTAEVTEPFAGLSFALVVPIGAWMLLAITWQQVGFVLTVHTGWVAPQWSDLIGFTTDSTLLAHPIRVLAGLVGLILAWRWAGRGIWVPALLLAAITVPQAWLWLSGVAPGGQLTYDPSSILVWLVVTVFVVASVLAVQGRLVGARLTSVLVAAAILVVYDLRYLLDEPFTLVVGFSSVAVLAVGLGWRALTDGDLTRGSSRALPRSSRVLLYMAGLVFATLAVAYGVLTRNFTSFADLNLWEDFGDWAFALPLLVCCVLIALWRAVGAAR